MTTHQFNLESFNPDSMTKDELWQWANFVGNGQRPQVAKQWFQGMRGQYRHARNIGHYCVNKAVAVELRESGKVDAAIVYEAICDRIYARLPESARW